MFRDVELHPKEKDYHRFLHRNPVTQLMEDWRMSRLTFGVTSSPYLAAQVLRQVADDYPEILHRTANTIWTVIYIDDCLHCTTTLEEALTLRKELNNLLQHACMKLQKWCSNSPNLLPTIPEDGSSRRSSHLGSRLLSEGPGRTLAYYSGLPPCRHTRGELPTKR